MYKERSKLGIDRSSNFMQITSNFVSGDLDIQDDQEDQEESTKSRNPRNFRSLDGSLIRKSGNMKLSDLVD